MKNTLLVVAFALTSMWGFSQTVVSIHDVQYVSPADLANCIDASAYDGDTVQFTGIAMHDGNLTEVASGSVNGGSRPGIHLLDTALLAGGNFAGVQVHGVYTDAQGQSQPVTAINNLVAGDIVTVVGVVSSYQGETQVYPLDNSSVTAINVTNAPQPLPINLGDLNDANRINQLVTGEPLEGSLVMLNNVTVTSVIYFSGGSRVSMDVTDAQGNTINVSDRFLVQKLPGYSTVNPNSPATNGTFVAPPVGLVYDTLIGIIVHSENGCTGGSGRGYEINPFDPSHYVIGVTPPAITEVKRNPTAPTSTQSPVVSCKVTDFDGTIASVKLYYTDDIAGGNFNVVNFTLNSGSTDEYSASIPAFSDGSMIGYYIAAEDNDGNISQFPATPSGSPTNNVKVYTVRDNGLTIVDIQKVLDPNKDASYYMGDTVTVTGVVCASSKDYDLGYVYIQQPGESEWSGLNLIGNSDLVLLLRTEEVTVTGVIQEDFGYTRMQVLDVQKTGKIIPNEITYFDPSDANLEMEKYEGMLMGMANGSGGLFMVDEDAGFGDYRIGTSASATHSTLVLAGRQSSSSYSSLLVSLISDAFYFSNDGQMEVDTVITTPTMEMDTLIGMLYYSFSNYRVMPRNNDDIINLSDNGTPILLDSTNLSLPDTTTSVSELNGKQIETTVFPNPAKNEITISVNGWNGNILVSIYDISGRLVKQTATAPQQIININFLENGLYMVRVSDMEGHVFAVEKLIKN
jgi:hypothetical protein